MRILLVADSLSNGGAERQMALLAAVLPPGSERLVCTIDDGPFRTVLDQEGIETVTLQRRQRIDPMPAVRLARLIVSYRPDVVHCWGWMGVLAAATPCRLLGIPLIDGSIRTGKVLHHRSRMYWLTARVANEVVANSRAGLASHPVPPKKGSVICNGFDERRLSAHVEERAWSSSPFTVVMTARMAPEKDFSTYMQAARVIAEDPSCADRFVFLAVGEGVARQELMEENRDLVREGVMRFLAPGMDVIGVLGRAHVGVLLTDPRMAVEGCSNSILEYMASGLPVVCSQGGGNAEVVREGITGFLIPPRDPERLVDRLRFLESHRAMATALGRAGQRRVKCFFGADRLARETMSVYCRVIDSKARS